MKKTNNTKFSIIVIIIIIIGLYFMSNNSKVNEIFDGNEDSKFKIISSQENEDLESIVLDYAEKEGIDVQIDYAGTLDIMEKLNSGEKYDAVWASNSIWLYMLNSDVKTKDSESTSINPVVFAVKKSKANELGFIGKDIYTEDIINSIESGKLKFSMANPTQTNSGATAYLGLLYSIAGSPEVLKKENIQNWFI